MFSPYDGSPEGNFFGAGVDDRQRRSLEIISDANEQEFVAPRSTLELMTYFLGLAVFATVFFFATVG